MLNTVGVYTASGYNGVALYQASGNTLNLVASSASNDNLWASAAGVLTVPFSASYSAQPGLYFIAMVWNRSAVTTAPVLAAISGSTVRTALDFSSGFAFSSTATVASAWPASLTNTNLTADSFTTWAAIY